MYQNAFCFSFIPCGAISAVTINFVLLNLVTLDYKTLMLLLIKKNDDKFMLGGRGVGVEFCFICNAIRVSTSSILKSNCNLWFY